MVRTQGWEDLTGQKFQRTAFEMGQETNPTGYLCHAEKWEALSCWVDFDTFQKSITQIVSYTWIAWGCAPIFLGGGMKSTLGK